MTKEIVDLCKGLLNEKVHFVRTIENLGSVNTVLELAGANHAYIVRYNTDLSKMVEYQKEAWCLHKVRQIDILSPKVLHIGNDKSNNKHSFCFMIQEKIEGQNGSQCTQPQKEIIWHTLGVCAQQFHQIGQIDDETVQKSEFHNNWKARLHYNIAQLNNTDSLLHQQLLTKNEQTTAKQVLLSLSHKMFKEGLVHGDLCPRNVIWQAGQVYLLDWGTAQVNIVPHYEIGQLLLNREATLEDLTLFLEGLGITQATYQNMQTDIYTINLLTVLDNYRWAEDNAQAYITTYGLRVKQSLSFFLNT